MKSNFRTYDIVLIAFFTAILILMFVADLFMNVKISNYLLALLIILLLSVIVHMIRSLQVEFERQKRKDMKVQSERYISEMKHLQAILEKQHPNKEFSQSILDQLNLKSDIITGPSAFYDKFEQNFSKKLGNLYNQIESLLSIYNAIGQMNFPLPGFRYWTISPDSMKIIISHIIKVKPKFILEFGSGASSVIIGYCLKNLNHGKLLSIDHNPDLSADKEDEIKNHGLQEFVEIIYAPLKVYNFDGKDYLWYSKEFATSMDKVDLMIIDGPPAFIQKNSRYPALRLMKDYLSDDATIFLDDAGRPGEKEIVTMWLDENKELKSKLIDTEEGLAVLYFS